MCTRRWPVGLTRPPKEAFAFYSTLAAAIALGVAITLSPIDPIKALYWTAVINGIIAVPIMTVMMLMTARSKIMGKFVIRGWLRWLGWASTATMAACVVGMLVALVCLIEGLCRLADTPPSRAALLCVGAKDRPRGCRGTGASLSNDQCVLMSL
jgi:hypothetical protein